MPAGFNHDEISIAIGRGHELFEACSEHLNRWGLQRALGFAVHPSKCIPKCGETILLTRTLPGATLVASCRIVYTVDETNRRGFAYGTLPMHPECGEEYFGITIDDDDVVHFEIRAFSRPSSTLARICKPLTRFLQLKATRKYCDEMLAVAKQLNQTGP